MILGLIIEKLINNFELSNSLSRHTIADFLCCAHVDSMAREKPWRTTTGKPVMEIHHKDKATTQKTMMTKIDSTQPEIQQPPIPKKEKIVTPTSNNDTLTSSSNQGSMGKEFGGSVTSDAAQLRRPQC